MPKAIIDTIVRFCDEYKEILLLILSVQLFFSFAPPLLEPLVTNDLFKYETVSFVRPWIRWDGNWYVGIAKDGYPKVIEGSETWKRIGFLPLYPVFIFLVSKLGISVEAAALLVSRVASFGAAVLLYFLAKREFNERVAFWALVTFLLFPTSFFLYAPYTEGLFLFLTIGSIYLARTGYWAPAGILVGLSVLTRVTGLVLVPTLVIEWWLQRKEGKMKVSHVLWPIISAGIAATILGLISYRVHGTAFMYFRALQEGWGKGLMWPWQSLWNAYVTGFFWELNPLNVVSRTAEFVAAVGLMVATVVGIRRLRLAYVVYMICSSLLLLSVSSLVSTGRYLLSVFPIFFLLGSFYKKYSFERVLWLVVSTTCLVVLCLRFVRNMWAF